MRLTAVKIASVPLGGFLLGALLGFAWAWASKDIPTATAAEYALHHRAIGQGWTIAAAAKTTQTLDAWGRDPSTGIWRPLAAKAATVAPLITLRARTVGGLLFASIPLWLFVWTMGKATAARRYKTAEGPNSFRAQIALSSGFAGLVLLGALLAVPVAIPTFAVALGALVFVLAATYLMRANSPLTI